MVVPARQELPLIRRPATGLDRDRLFGRQMVGEHLVLALMEGQAPGIANGRGKATSGVGLPMISIEQEPALSAYGADPPC